MNCLKHDMTNHLIFGGADQETETDVFIIKRGSACMNTRRVTCL